MSFSVEVQDAVKSLRFKKTRFILFELDANKTVQVNYISTRKEDKADLIDRLDDIGSRFIGYDFEYVTRDGRIADKMFFMYYKPDNTSQISKIAYSQILQSFKNACFPGFEYKELESIEDIEDLMEEEKPDPSRM